MRFKPDLFGDIADNALEGCREYITLASKLVPTLTEKDAALTEGFSLAFITTQNEGRMTPFAYGVAKACAKVGCKFEHIWIRDPNTPFPELLKNGSNIPYIFETPFNFTNTPEWALHLNAWNVIEGSIEDPTPITSYVIRDAIEMLSPNLHVLVVGRGTYTRDIPALLLDRHINSTVTVAHTGTTHRQLIRLMEMADVIVWGAGEDAPVPSFVPSDHCVFMDLTGNINSVWLHGCYDARDMLYYGPSDIGKAVCAEVVHRAAGIYF